jgi:DNA (cytosine-5)-methyltransferase 1
VNLVSHSLTANGFDASEDGTGRGTPLVAHALTACKTASGRVDPSNDTLIPFDTGQVTSKQNRSRCEPGDPCHTLPAQGHVPSIAYAIQERAVSENPNTGPQGKGYAAETAYTLEARHHQQSVAYCFTDQRGRQNESGIATEYAHTLHAAKGQSEQQIVSNRFGVRRLMPIECERLQGFPDDWTRFGADGEEMADSARYRMCGNAVAVPCIEWIGRRLMEAAGD